MKRYFDLACLFAVAIHCAGAVAAENTRLTICNHNPDRAIFSSHMKQAGGGAGWQSTGWFKVEAAACLDMDLGSYTGSIFLYAQDDTQESSWGEGSVKFCINKTSPFTINNADVTDCSDSRFKKVASDQLTVGPGKTTWDVRPNYSQLNFCNLNPDFPIFASFARPIDDSLVSRGWFEVAAGACRLVTVGKYTGPVSYFGKGRQFVWEGDATRFCTNRTLGFQLSNADQPSSCVASGLEMVSPRKIDVQIGANTVMFEPVKVDTILNVCNDTDRLLFSSRALRTGDGVWQSTGWNQLDPKKCVESNLGNYVGKAFLYAEWNLGEMFWGQGPFNFCVHRTQSFNFADSTNTTQCNSDINLKMVPSFEFVLKPGMNTFTFRP